MKNIAVIDKDYKQWINEIRGRYRQSQIKAALKVNSEMLQFYWLLGHDIVERKMENTYGSGFFNRLSSDLQRELPDAKGFSPTNIKYFKYFYELYSPLLENRPQVADDSKSHSICQQVVDESTSQIRPQVADNFNRPIIPQVAEELFSIPWDHHRRIIDKCKGNPQKALFFVQKTRENNWSRAVLLNFLDTDLYEREGKAITNCKAVLPAPDSDLEEKDSILSSQGIRKHVCDILEGGQEVFEKREKKYGLR